MSLTSRILTIAAAGALVVAGVIGYSSFNDGVTAQNDTASSGRVVFHRGNGAEPSSLDPHKASGTWENNIIGDMFLGLYTEDVLGEPVYGVISNHTISDDLLVHTFTLRDDQLWSDGVPVTAHDFEYALRRIIHPATAARYASILYLIENAETLNTADSLVVDMEPLGVHALDDYTLEIRLNNPAPYLPQLLTHYTTFPVPMHLLEESSDTWTRPGTMVSNGAYILAEWTPNDHITIVKNPHFYDADNVQIEEVVFYPTDDESAALRRFRAGELDANTGFPSQQYEWLLENMPEETRIAQYIATTYILFNLDDPLFQDLRVRQALSMTMNRQIITDRVLRTGQTPTFTLVPPLMPNYESPEVFFQHMTYEERVDAARELMRDAGYGPDNLLEFEYRYMEGIDSRRMAVAIAGFWNEIYVDVSLINTEPAIHYNDLQSRNYAMGGAGWIADYADPENYLFLFDSATGAMNYSNYNNPEYDALLAQAAVTADLEVRSGILHQAEALILSEVPFIPTHNSVSKSLVAQHLIGWEDNVVHIHRTRYMSIDESKRATQESFMDNVRGWFN